MSGDVTWWDAVAAVGAVTAALIGLYDVVRLRRTHPDLDLDADALVETLGVTDPKTGETIDGIARHYLRIMVHNRGNLTARDVQVNLILFRSWIADPDRVVDSPQERPDGEFRIVTERITPWFSWAGSGDKMSWPIVPFAWTHGVDGRTFRDIPPTAGRLVDILYSEVGKGAATVDEGHGAPLCLHPHSTAPWSRLQLGRYALSIEISARNAKVRCYELRFVVSPGEVALRRIVRAGPIRASDL